ncbi:hypothetical protein GMYAFLOJ_CDS0045 [Microbacterium phage phiMiGM15]
MLVAALVFALACAAYALLPWVVILGVLATLSAFDRRA